MVFTSRFRLWVGSGVALAALAGFVLLPRAYGASKETTLARKAVSADPTVSLTAIAALRARGPEGLQALFDTYGDVIQTHQGSHVTLASAERDGNWQRLMTALDAVSRQRDDYASHLYWYTDLEQAKQAARAGNKPILSLRLLGNLDQELSCANSRFFRSALYPNSEIATYLRDHYVLHWKSVRPAPKVTIDFGDGRKLETTITGNSIHYILDPNGRPLDALPGLYGPQAFLRELKQDALLANRLSKLSTERQAAALRDYHKARLAALTTAWKSEVSQVPLPHISRAAANQAPTANKVVDRTIRLAGTGPTAAQAAPLAISKLVVEAPIVSRISPNTRPGSVKIDHPIWIQLAPFHLQDARLDANSIALIRSKMPVDSPSLATSPSRETTLKNLVLNFESTIAADTARNEYGFHSLLHQWFIQGDVTGDLDTLNEKVYAEMFLTPRSDQWLGLLPTGVYTALPNEGVVK
jgi:hypothetical protein